MIYYIHREDYPDHVKIGYTDNLLERMRALRQGHRLTLLGIHWGGMGMEKAVHHKFQHLRSPCPGFSVETFRVNEELATWIMTQTHSTDPTWGAPK